MIPTERVVRLSALADGIGAMADGEEGLVLVDTKINDLEIIEKSIIQTAAQKGDAESVRQEPFRTISVEPLGGSASQVDERLRCVACRNGYVIVGDEAGSVRSWNLANENTSVVCAELDGAVRCVAMNSKARVAAAHGDHGEVRVAQVFNRSQRKVCAASRVRIVWVVWEPSSSDNDDYSRLAMLDAQGRLSMWRLELDAEEEDLAEDIELGVAKFGNGGEFWSFDWKRQQLAVPGRRGQLVLLPPLAESSQDWAEKASHFFFPDENQCGVITNCAFDAKGEKIATITDTRLIVIWAAENAFMSNCQPVAIVRLDDEAASPRTLLFSANQLLIASDDGRLAVAGGSSAWTYPREASTLKKKKVTFNDQPDTFIQDEAVEDDEATTQIEEDDDDEDMQFIRRKPSSKPDDDDDDDAPPFGDSAENNSDNEDEPHLNNDNLDLPDLDAINTDTGDDYQRITTSSLTAPQNPFQPGATYSDETAQFLHWSSRGSIISRRVAETEEEEDAEDGEFVFVIEVEHYPEHETRARTLRFTSRCGHECATLGNGGAAFATKCEASTEKEDSETTLCQISFRALGAWHAHSWETTLQSGERCIGLAAGDDWVAAVTDRKWCRIYSVGGVADAVFSLQGKPVATAAARQFFAIAYHATSPSTHSGEQNIAISMYDVHRRSLVSVQNNSASGIILPLAKGIELAWLGFADDDAALFAMDSNCVLYALLHDFGWTWTPVLDGKRQWREQHKERKRKLLDESRELGLDLSRVTDEEDVYQWPVFARGGNVYCATLKHGSHEPKPTPRPILAPIPLEGMLASAAYDVDTRDAEQSLFAPTALARHRLTFASVYAHILKPQPMTRLVAGPHQVEENNEWTELLQNATRQAITARDKALLRQMVSAVKADQLQYALDTAQRLSLPDSLDVALRIADSKGLDAFSARVEALVNARDLLDSPQEEIAFPEQDHLMSPPPSAHNSSVHNTPVAQDEIEPLLEEAEEEVEEEEQQPPPRKLAKIFAARPSNNSNKPPKLSTPKQSPTIHDGNTGPVANPFAANPFAVQESSSSAKKRDALDSLATLAFSPRNDKPKKRSAAHATIPINKLQKLGR
uniref:Minichromosome loss protein Mcl1 middle region domain-containing protein n=1 Tax=Aureoumbra lagunensis TaxID=44058 RepID=A0A7S3K3E4_9STRA